MKLENDRCNISFELSSEKRKLLNIALHSGKMKIKEAFYKSIDEILEHKLEIKNNT